MSQWEPPADVAAVLPCPWEMLSDAEREFVRAMVEPLGVGASLFEASERIALAEGFTQQP